MTLEELFQTLKAEYPQGLPGERDALVTALMQKGLPHPEAVRAAEALEAQGYAHFLPGERSRWTFTPRPLDLKALVRSLDQARRQSPTPLEEEAIALLAAQLDGDREVAQEVLEALRLAGYVENVYDPEQERSYLLFHFPEALRLLG